MLGRQVLPDPLGGQPQLQLGHNDRPEGLTAAALPRRAGYHNGGIWIGRTGARRRRGIGDLDGDGAVSVHDLATLLAHFGEEGAGPIAGDLNGDGLVDLTDVRRLLENFGAPCDSRARRAKNG